MRCQTLRTLTFSQSGVSYPAFLKRVRVRYLELGLGLVLLLGLDLSVKVWVTELGLRTRLGLVLESPGVRNAWVRKG